MIKPYPLVIFPLPLWIEIFEQPTQGLLVLIRIDELVDIGINGEIIFLFLRVLIIPINKLLKQVLKIDDHEIIILMVHCSVPLQSM